MLAHCGRKNAAKDMRKTAEAMDPDYNIGVDREKTTCTDRERLTNGKEFDTAD